jgi:transcriptional regulator with XRE-family HTH domain
MDLVQRLKMLRKHFRISQSKMGDILSVRQQAVSHYEKTGNIEASKLEILADYFRLDIKYFYENDSIEKYELKKQTVQELSTGSIVIPAGWENLLEDISALRQQDIKRIENILLQLIKLAGKTED